MRGLNLDWWSLPLCKEWRKIIVHLVRSGTRLRCKSNLDVEAPFSGYIECINPLPFELTGAIKWQTEYHSSFTLANTNCTRIELRIQPTGCIITECSRFNAPCMAVPLVPCHCTLRQGFWICPGYRLVTIIAYRFTEYHENQWYNLLHWWV